jgi:hypothetical protein
MKTIGDLLTRDLSRKIEEIIQVDQADEQSVHDEITEYVATESIREQYHELLKAVAEAPTDPHESVAKSLSAPSSFGDGDVKAKPSSLSSTKSGSTSLGAATKSKTCGPPSRNSARLGKTCSKSGR